MRKLYIRWLALIAVIATMASTALPVLAATPPEPTYGSARVDGDPSEWNPSDFFADMWEAGRPDKPNPQKLSQAYLRYDCLSTTLYVLVLANDGYQIMANKPEDNWVKIYDIGNSALVHGNSGNDGTPPDFAWVKRDGEVVKGWEASIQLEPKEYQGLEIHAQIQDDRTSSTGKAGIPLTLICLGLGDFVWRDTNPDGIQDSGELGIKPVPIWLFKDLCNTSLNYNEQPPIAKTYTEGNGIYRFSNLNPGGSYCVIIPGEAFSVGGPLAGLDPSPKEQGSDRSLDSNGELQPDYNYVWASVALDHQDDWTIDFGFFSAPPTAVTLSSLSARSGMAWPAGSLVWIAAGIALAGGAATLYRRRR